MAQAGFTPIQLYRTTTASAQPSAGNLAAGELAINLTDKKLYAKDASNNVFLLADASSGGTTAANLAGGAAGSLPYQSGANATTFLGIGAANRVLTSSGTAPQWVTSLTGLTGVSSSSITNTSLTATRLVYSTTGGAQTDSANLTFDGTSLTINGSPNLILSSSGIERGRIVTGTGAVELMAGSTTTPTISMASNVATFTNNPVLSGGTANGVLYLDGSKVATSGSALTFDGTNFATTGRGTFGQRIQVTGNTAPSTGAGLELFYDGTVAAALAFARGTGYLPLGLDGSDIRFYASSSEQMRLTSTGLGIGTSSPAYKLDVVGEVRANNLFRTTDGTNIGLFGSSVFAAGVVGVGSSNSVPLVFGTAATERMRLDSSGNLGLGVTPSAWGSGFVALDIDAVTSLACEQDVTTVLGQNCYNNGGWKYRATNIFGVSRYDQFNGSHIWQTAPSGTAGNTISFTQAMTLDASGNLFVGRTTPITQITFSGGDGITYQRSTDNTFSGVLDYLKSRGSAASPTAVQNGDDLFTLRVAPYHGSAYTYLANTVVQVDGTFTSGQNPPTRITWYTNAANGSSTERARITSGGDLLVGTTTNSGGTRLKSKVAAGTPGLEVTDEVQSDFIVTPLSGAVCRVGPSAGAMAFYSANNERARITSGGSLVVGTAALATTATDGFLYVPTCAGTPTGTPTTQTGTAPIVVDTTNNKLYFYSGGQWRDAGP